MKKLIIISITLFTLIFGFLWGFSSYHFKYFPYNEIKKIVKHKPKDPINYSLVTEKNKIR